MPHINVKMLPGRDEELKKALADNLLKVAQETLGCPASVLSVSVQDVEHKDWNAKVADVIPEDKVYSGQMYVAKK